MRFSNLSQLTVSAIVITAVARTILVAWVGLQVCMTECMPLLKHLTCGPALRGDLGAVQAFIHASAGEFNFLRLAWIGKNTHLAEIAGMPRKCPVHASG